MTVWVKTTLTSRAFLRGLGEVFAHWLNSLPACDGGVRVLRVMSHGHSLATLDGTVVGSDISVGKTENIRSDDFDNDGNLLATTHAQQTKKLLDAFKASVSPNGRLIFSACEQGTGRLLQHISQHLDKHVSVEGWSRSRLGFPSVRAYAFTLLNAASAEGNSRV